MPFNIWADNKPSSLWIFDFAIYFWIEFIGISIPTLLKMVRIIKPWFTIALQTIEMWIISCWMIPEFILKKKYETELGIDPEQSINIVKQTRNYHVYILKWNLYIFENTLSLVAIEMTWPTSVPIYDLLPIRAIAYKLLVEIVWQPY